MLVSIYDNSFAGEKVFMLGDQWIGNQTGDQLEQFDIIRISSYKDTSVFRAVTDTLNRKLMIAIAEPHAQKDSAVYAQAVLDSFDNQNAGSFSIFRWA